MQAVLIKNNIFVNFEEMTKREIVEIFESKKVSIIDGEDDACRIYQDDKLIGEWDNKRRIVINKEGCLTIKIRYAII
jgi:hypothetical protein